MRAVLAVALLAGLLYAVVTPPDRVPDEYGHFLRAVAIAEGNVFPRVGLRSPGHHFPAGIWMFGHQLFKGDMRAAYAEPLNREKRAGIEFPAWYSPVPYAIPAAVAFVGLHADLRPFWIFYLGRIANLLACLGIAWLALRAIPKRAAVAAAVLLLPMTLYELASWSADAMTISVALLLTCLIVRNMEAEGSMGAMAAVAFVLGLCKPVYFLLALPALAIRRRTGIVVIAAMLLGTLLAAASARSGQYNPRPELPVDPGQQLRCVLDDPLRFAGIFLGDMRVHGRFYLEETVGRLGLMDVKLPVVLIVAEWLLLLWVALSSGVRWRMPARLGALAACALTIGGISLAQYLIWSVICGDTIEGVQGRYYLPLLPLLLFALSLRPCERGPSLIPVAVAGMIANGVALAVLYDHYWR